MNPIAIAGVLAVTVASTGLMISFSGQQVQYSQTVEQTASLQAERLQENLSVTAGGGVLFVENTGPLPVQIREIRVLDDAGHVILAQKADDTARVSQTIQPDMGADLTEALQRILKQR